MSIQSGRSGSKVVPQSDNFLPRSTARVSAGLRLTRRAWSPMSQHLFRINAKPPAVRAHVDHRREGSYDLSKAEPRRCATRTAPAALVEWSRWTSRVKYSTGRMVSGNAEGSGDLTIRHKRGWPGRAQQIRGPRSRRLAVPGNNRAACSREERSAVLSVAVNNNTAGPTRDHNHTTERARHLDDRSRVSAAEQQHLP